LKLNCGCGWGLAGASAGWGAKERCTPRWKPFEEEPRYWQALLQWQLIPYTTGIAR